MDYEEIELQAPNALIVEGDEENGQAAVAVSSSYDYVEGESTSPYVVTCASY